MKTLTVLIVGFLVSSAQAGVVLTMETVDGKAKTVTVAKVEPDRFRVDVDGGKQTVIYRKDKDAFWMLNPGKKTYSEMTRKDIQAMSERMSGAMKQMEDQMKDLPPAQRAQIEAMMKGRMGGQPSAPTYQKMASGQKVGTWVATQYAVLRDGKKTSEVFHAHPKAVGLVEADFAVFTSLADLFKSMTKDLENTGFYRAGKVDGAVPAGVLVRSVRLDDAGKPGAVSTLTEVKRGAVAGSEFEVPAGYTREKSPMAGGHDHHDHGDGHDHDH